MSSFLLYFIAFWIALLPVYLWGYGVTYMLSDTWNRMRFWIGLLLGGFGVGLTYIFASSYSTNSVFEIGVFVGFLLALFLIVFFGRFLVLGFRGYSCAILQ